jgi:hypothetical protein
MGYEYYYSMLLSQAKVLDQNSADSKKARKVNQAQQKKKRAKNKDKGTTAASAAPAPAQPKLAPNNGLPAGHNPEVKHIPDEIWPKLTQAQKDEHFRKHKMGKYSPFYDPKKLKPNLQNKTANQAEA